MVLEKTERASQLSRAKTCAGWPLTGYIAMRSLPARWINFGSFCESVPRQFLLLGLPVIPGAATGTQVLQFDKKSGAYHTSFNHQRSTKSPSRTQKCIKIKGVTRWRELGGFFSNQRESISRCPKSPFSSKTQTRKITRTSPLTRRKSCRGQFPRATIRKRRISQLFPVPET